MKPLLLCIGVAMLAAMWMLAAACYKQSSNKSEGRERRVVLQRQLGQLESEAERLEDVRALKRLQRAFGYYVDQGMWSQAADLFEPQGTIEIGLDGVYVGQKRIRQYLLAYGGGREGLKRGQLNEHLMLQPVIHVAGDGRTAKARWRALIEKHPERFLAASDYRPPVEQHYRNSILRQRTLILDVLSERARHLVAYGNAWRLVAGMPWVA